jgi:hypothetical protein
MNSLHLEWLMPSSRRFQALELRIHDATHAVAHGRTQDRDGVADVVLVRELAHHGHLSRVVLE